MYGVYISPVAIFHHQQQDWWQQRGRAVAPKRKNDNNVLKEQWLRRVRKYTEGVMATKRRNKNCWGQQWRRKNVVEVE